MARIGKVNRCVGCGDKTLNWHVNGEVPERPMCGRCVECGEPTQVVPITSMDVSFLIEALHEAISADQKIVADKHKVWDRKAKDQHRHAIQHQTQLAEYLEHWRERDPNK